MTNANGLFVDDFDSDVFSSENVCGATYFAESSGAEFFMEYVIASQH